MRKLVSSLICLLLVFALAAPAMAREMKLGYVDSERILETFDDYKTALQKLQEEERGYVTQAQGMEQVVTEMSEELKSQSLMLSEEARTERENRLKSKMEELDNFRREIWGENGRLFNRNLELSKPVLDKINAAIQKVSQEDNYDMVFDAASANIVYALPELDITDKVLDELKKE